MRTTPLTTHRMPPVMPRVLLVDDDEDDQFLIRQAFTTNKRDCQLFFAMNGEECLRFLSEVFWLPDLVLLDLNMPCLNGLEVLQHLKAIPRWHGLTVVVLSTTSDSKTRQQVLKLGATVCLTKPHHHQDYQRLVDELCTLYL